MKNTLTIVMFTFVGMFVMEIIYESISSRLWPRESAVIRDQDDNDGCAVSLRMLLFGCIALAIICYFTIR